MKRVSHLTPTLQTSVATVIITYWILLLLLGIVTLAYPRFRSLYHDRFEMSHRFLGWTATAFVWCQVCFLSSARYFLTKKAELSSRLSSSQTTIDCRVKHSETLFRMLHLSGLSSSSLSLSSFLGSDSAKYLSVQKLCLAMPCGFTSTMVSQDHLAIVLAKLLC